ncbi:alpha/beta fold hydrolase [Streptomyces sp. NPDC059224]|uniref:alpha/beta fold hydrolase n=1 Tax=Streptomyces sp. NPDC059224 TaxID=3346775 RepID=UPI00367DBD95
MSKSIVRRSLLATAAMGAATVLGAAGLAAANAGPATDTDTAQNHKHQQKPTVVLVHGAFAESASWNGVIDRLERHGYHVIAPANPLRGLHSDAAYLASVLHSVKGPVVLAGHSYGGSVISEAAADNKNVKALVYIAAFTPDRGESASELSGKFPGSTLGATLNKVPFPQPDGSTGTDLYIRPDKFRGQFAADVSAKEAARMAVTQRPIAANALDETATATAWKSIPSWNLITRQDKNIPVAAQRWMAHRAHSHTTEIDASHAVTVSQPGAVTRIIEQAATTNSR